MFWQVCARWFNVLQKIVDASGSPNASITAEQQKGGVGEEQLGW